MSFGLIIHYGLQIPLAFCTGHGSHISVLCVIFQKNSATHKEAMNKLDFGRFRFKTTFRWILYSVTIPWPYWGWWESQGFISIQTASLINNRRSDNNKTHALRKPSWLDAQCTFIQTIYGQKDAQYTTFIMASCHGNISILMVLCAGHW